VTLAAIFGCEGLHLTAREYAFFRDAQPWGFILFARNVADPAQVTRLVADLRNAVGRRAPVLIDQEGGRVQRLRAPHWREWPPPLATASAAADPERALWLQYRLIAAELSALGIDANCAPCGDIAMAQTHPFLRNRCLGTDAAAVARHGRAVADALLHGGVLPVLKHLPGHGRATLDTHLALPTVTAHEDDLAATDFAPFRALADLPMAMTAHVVFAAFSEEPATLSPEMVSVIREDLGFAGLLMTDDLNMEALSGTLAERTLRARAAGVDMILHCKGDMDQMTVVADAAGQLDGMALARAEAALAARVPARPVDLDALGAEWSTLTAGLAAEGAFG
jgi:beta-N-acetylhexosaminidase